MTTLEHMERAVAALRACAAAAGDRRGSMEALERAYHLMDTVSAPPGDTEFVDPPRLDGVAEAVYRLLRNTDRAVPLLRQALDHRAPTDAKRRALVLLDLADCYVVTGEPEEGARSPWTHWTLLTVRWSSRSSRGSIRFGRG